jgi:hypothetical protein
MRSRPQRETIWRLPSTDPARHRAGTDFPLPLIK